MMRSRKNQKKILSKQCIQSSYTFTPHLEVMRGKNNQSDSLTKQYLSSFTPQHGMVRSVGSPENSLYRSKSVENTRDAMMKTYSSSNIGVNMFEKITNLDELPNIANKDTDRRYRGTIESNIKAKIHSIWSENGKKKPAYNGWLKDDVGEIQFSIWFEPRFELNVGNFVEIKSFALGEYRNNPTIKLNSKTDVEKLQVDEEPLDRKPEERKPKMDKIGDINGPSKNLHMIARAVKVTELHPNGKLKKIAKLIDRTGEISLKIWFDCDISEGDVIHIKGCYMDLYEKENELEIELNERDFLEKLPDNAMDSKKGLEIFQKVVNGDVPKIDHKSVVGRYR